MTLKTLADIVGPYTGKLIPNATAPVKARWMMFTAQSGGGTTAVVGDANSGATQGAHLVANVPVIYPENGADPTDCYDLTQCTAYVPTGTTLTTTYAV